MFYSIWLTAWVDAIIFFKPNDDIEKQDCGYGAPWTDDFLQTNKCFGNSFYLGIYGLIGTSIAILSFSKSILQLQGKDFIVYIFSFFRLVSFIYFFFSFFFVFFIFFFHLIFFQFLETVFLFLIHCWPIRARERDTRKITKK